MRRVVTCIKWFFIVIVGLTLIGAASGSVYQYMAQTRDLEAYPPPGQLVDVDGRTMHIHCQGNGSPTVIVEQGGPYPAVTWAQVNREMAKFTRVCAYDRAGLGYSEPLDRPQSIADVATRLNKMLQTAAIDDDLVLVGWSAGGIYIREYYAQFPEAVKAMVFVDSSHEQQLSREHKRPGAGSGDSSKLLQVVKYLAPLGVFRASGFIEQQANRLPMPDDVKAPFIAQMSQSHTIGAMANEIEGLTAELRQNKTPKSLGDLPVLVLSRGEELVLEEGMPAWVTMEYMKKSRAAWTEMQLELAALSTRGRHLLATRSDHNIHAREPELVVGSVKEMVDLVRSESVAASSVTE